MDSGSKMHSVDFDGANRLLDGDRIRRNALRSMTLVTRAIQHPTWAAANLRNFLDQQHDRKNKIEIPESNCSLQEALELIACADQQNIAHYLASVPRPNLHRQSVLYGDPDGSRELVKFLYACCRLLTPRIVVETGVANGFSTAAILQALSENGQGTLVSIDLPHLHPRAEKSIGAAVDPILYSRWRLHLGPASRILSNMKLGSEIDMFVQDASHTSRGQMAEYRAAWPRIARRGLLISDDVGNAFDSFATEVGCRPIYVDQAPKSSPIGILIKSTEH